VSTTEELLGTNCRSSTSFIARHEISCKEVFLDNQPTKDGVGIQIIWDSSSSTLETHFDRFNINNNYV
jgi:hypothetical protein